MIVILTLLTFYCLLCDVKIVLKEKFDIWGYMLILKKFNASLMYVY